MKTLPFLAIACFCGSTGCAVTSMADAIKKNADLLPQPQYVLLPMTNETKLGRLAGASLDAAAQDSRRITVSPAPCFFVAPTEGGGVKDVHITYKSSQDVSVELKQINTNVGGKADLQHQNNATLDLKNIRTRKGVGVPDLNSACRNLIERGEHLLVITAETLAGDMALDYSEAIKTEIKADIVIPQGGLNIGAGVGATLGQDGTISAKDLIFAGQLTDLTVTVQKTEIDLGTTPMFGRKIDFPKGFDGSLTIKGFDASANQLTISVSAALYANAAAPKDFKTCPVSGDHPLNVGDRCDFWLSSGSSLISVQWNIKDVRGQKHIVMAVNGYGSNFAKNPTVIP